MLHRYCYARAFRFDIATAKTTALNAVAATSAHSIRDQPRDGTTEDEIVASSGGFVDEDDALNFFATARVFFVGAIMSSMSGASGVFSASCPHAPAMSCPIS